MTEYEKDEWIAVIQNNIEHALNASGPPSSARRPSDLQLVSPGSLPGNDVCADCGAFNPTWCCINWGTCICIRCSGVHREMTTSVSKVRSLTLDRLDSKLTALFRAIGNTKANEILEATMPPGTKIAENADREARTAFLKRKYAACEFVDRSTIVDVKAAILAGDTASVFVGVCQMRQARESDPLLLHYAAGIGNPTIALIVGLNSESLNALDRQGWSALSYAAYFGSVAVAQALISIGCDPNASPAAHPFAVASAQRDDGATRLFQPYWNLPEKPPVRQYTPELEIEPHVQPEHEGGDASTFATFQTIRSLGTRQ
jgi:hypothetical protein